MDGLIVVGSSEGLYRLDSISNALDADFFCIPDTLRAHFTCAERDGDSLWVGTNKKGLFLFSAENGELLWPKDKGTTLQDEIIYDFLLDKNGNLWFSTNHGIYCYNLKTESYNRYGVKDGLKVHEFNSGAAFKTDDALYFGGINGLEFFNPNHLRLTKAMRHKPVLQYTYSKAEGKQTKTIDLSDSSGRNCTIKMPHKFGYLDIVPMLGHYQDPGNNNFILKLDGNVIYPEQNGHYLFTEDKLKHRWWFWKTYNLEVAFRGGNSDWVPINAPVVVERGYNWELIFAIIFALILVYALYKAYRNSKKLQSVHKSINEVSQMTTTDEICKMALKHLTEGLGYEYAAISLVDFEERYLRTKYVKDEKLSTEIRTPIWKEKSQYPFEHGDILARVRATKEFVVVVWNKIISHTSIEDLQNLFNDDISIPLGHKEMARGFHPHDFSWKFFRHQGAKARRNCDGGD
ncbi:MAG: hypothetical protein IPN76_18685 [Saprospiraceae bacterium]|nr:hypothetical protein [Saprospiraceae bacterium]